MAQGQRSNNLLVPQARKALEQFKYEVAQELGIQVPQHGYWGDIPSRLNGAVGGNMVRRMIAAAEQSLINQATAGVQTGFRQALGSTQFTTGSTGQSQTQNPASSYYQPQGQQFQ